jgi:signal peptidase
VSRIGSLALFVAWFVLLRPGVLGGPAQYVIVTGDSMDPGLHGGDLIVSLTRPTYHVGDVVVYRVPSTEPAPFAGRKVVHRIVGGDAAGGFILQGDNAPHRDLWKVGTGDIAGRVAFWIPAAGRLLIFLRNPLLVASIAAGFAFVFMVWSPSRPKPGSPVPGGSVSPDDHPGRRHAAADSLAASLARAVVDVALIGSHAEAQVARMRAAAASALEARRAALELELARERDRRDRELEAAEAEIAIFEARIGELESKALAVVGRGAHAALQADRQQARIADQSLRGVGMPVAIPIDPRPAAPMVPLSLSA